ncbi:MAG TPA: selenium metabolism-associated LysR family transcriptional regulator [Anaerolineae bacterium]
MLGIHELQVFVAAAETENFSAAARKLQLSQPAISFQIQSLEQQLNVQLFQRTGRRISLTEAGRDLLPMAREMLNYSTRIEETMCARQGIVKGSVQIGCSTGPGKYVLPHLIGAFRKRYPDVQFSVHVMDRRSVEDRLLSQQIHIGVVGLHTKNSDLECWPLFMDHLVLIVAPTHCWADRPKIPLAQLQDAQWIFREEGAASRQLVEASLAESGIDSRSFNVAMELASPEAVETAVEAGHGVSFVSQLAVRHALELGRIIAVDVEGLTVQRQIYLARNRHRTCTCAQLRFREFVESDDGQALLAQLV